MAMHHLRYQKITLIMASGKIMRGIVKHFIKKTEGNYVDKLIDILCSLTKILYML